MMHLRSVLALIALPTAIFAQGGGDGGSSMFSILPMMLVMFVIIYFLMIRPEQKKQKKRQEMISEMKKGDKVLTIGGLYGKIANVKGETVSLKVAENITVEVAKSAVSSVVTNEDAKKES